MVSVGRRASLLGKVLTSISNNGALAVRIPASGAPNSHGVTGGVYKARERIHRGILIRDY